MEITLFKKGNKYVLDEKLHCEFMVDETEIETYEKENNFWKYAVPVFLVLAVIYFISRI